VSDVADECLAGSDDVVAGLRYRSDGGGGIE
jgi:hypothetical protein